ncbi:hypothetical protein [Roseateles sp.]|uniref:hypothetical protein n=1 Tax=Roseateles sp. TaxID=1971397 RepID=UPI00326636B1
MRSSVCAGWLLVSAMAAEASCTRPIEVPMSPIGLSVTFDGERAGGIYPTLLRELAATTGCEFLIKRVPRARLQKMFESSQADLLLPASASPSRDGDGEFVPLIQVRASLLTLTRSKALPQSLAELIAQPGFKLAVVRGFTFGAEYDRMVATLREQKRLIEEPDAVGVARALRMGLAHGTVMAASIFIGTLVSDATLTPLIKQVSVDPLEGLGWAESGVYLSRHSLAEADRRTLRLAFAQMAKTGRLWQLFVDMYPPGSLGVSIRPY